MLEITNSSDHRRFEKLDHRTFGTLPWQLKFVIHNKSRARYYCSLKLGSNLKYLNILLSGDALTLQ